MDIFSYLSRTHNNYILCFRAFGQIVTYRKSFAFVAINLVGLSSSGIAGIQAKRFGRLIASLK
jgi:hypothetical protein